MNLLLKGLYFLDPICKLGLKIIDLVLKLFLLSHVGRLECVGHLLTLSLLDLCVFKLLLLPLKLFGSLFFLLNPMGFNLLHLNELVLGLSQKSSALLKVSLEG